MTLFTPSSGAVVCYGELLLRMAAPRGEQLLQRPALEVCVGGAEANVAIGTGDAFAAALLHGMLRGWSAGDCIRFGLAAACSKHSIAGDMYPLSEAQILATMEGSLDVRR